jgi:hypothetical protein
MTTDEYARFYKALADYYHVDRVYKALADYYHVDRDRAEKCLSDVDRDRAEKCLSDIVDIMSNSEPDWVKSILERLREHYTR